MKTKTKVFIGIGVYLAIAILMLLIFGSSGKNEAFQPQNEFKLEPWVSIHLGGIDLSINKAVLYLRAGQRPDDLSRWSGSRAACSRSRTGCRPRSRSPTT